MPSKRFVYISKSVSARLSDPSPTDMVRKPADRQYRPSHRGVRNVTSCPRSRSALATGTHGRMSPAVPNAVNTIFDTRQSRGGIAARRTPLLTTQVRSRRKRLRTQRGSDFKQRDNRSAIVSTNQSLEYFKRARPIIDNAQVTLDHHTSGMLLCHQEPMG